MTILSRRELVPRLSSFTIHLKVYCMIEKNTRTAHWGPGSTNGLLASYQLSHRQRWMIIKLPHSSWFYIRTGNINWPKSFPAGNRTRAASFVLIQNSTPWNRVMYNNHNLNLIFNLYALIYILTRYILEGTSSSHISRVLVIFIILFLSFT